MFSFFAKKKTIIMKMRVHHSECYQQYYAAPAAASHALVAPAAASPALDAQVTSLVNGKCVAQAGQRSAGMALEGLR
jgi:hypothetical protein